MTRRTWSRGLPFRLRRRRSALLASRASSSSPSASRRWSRASRAAPSLRSGEGETVKELNLQDLKDINAAVAALHITTNPAVLQACSNLDERESRGFLVADLSDIELLPGCEAPTEGHKIGKRVEELLADAKGADDRLRGAAKTRRSKLRGKQLDEVELQQKLAASEAKWARDRTALCGAPSSSSSCRVRRLR